VKLADLGEDRFVSLITRGLPSSVSVRVGAGDDCAVLGGARDKVWRLLKTDAVVEGVHFEPGEKMRRVGWKALCRNLSDIAAMGGRPGEAVVTVALPAAMEVRHVRDLYAGLTRAARRYGVAIVGGETCRSPGPMFVSVALTGEVERARCILRSGGRPGDLLYVTGVLGGSRAKKHLDFQPRLQEAQWLTAHHRLRAMMDVSDGLGADLPRLARASGCGFELWEHAVPRSPGCSLAQALGDGEDFELLFALSPRAAAGLEREWRAMFPRLPLTRVGALTTARKTKDLSTHGFDHFA
jgi:thiamine-monophosphate kinase